VLPVPPASGYRVSYQVSTGLDFIPTGYYGSEGTVTSSSGALKLDLTSGGKEGIDLSLVYYNSISGTVSLPEGVAPKEGVTLTVFAANSRNKSETTVTIPSGKSSANYNITFLTAMDTRYIMS